MKRWLSVVLLALAGPVVLAASADKQAAAPVPGTKGGRVLEVSALLREADRTKGPVRIEGVVSKVYPKEQRLGLIDAAEFKKCGMVSACCDNQILPVQWTGSMPAVKSLVLLEGEIRDTGGKLEFVARSLEKVPAR